MADYTDIARVKRYLNAPTGGDDDDTTLTEMITAISRMFDRETDRAPGYWSPATAVTRRYSGKDDQWLGIDAFDTLTSGMVYPDARDLTDGQVISFTDPSATYYALPYPLDEPPYVSLFLEQGWPGDRHRIGNVRITGNTVLHPEIQHAVTAWVVHEFKGRNAGYADQIMRMQGPTLAWSTTIPANVREIITQFRAVADQVTGASWFV